MRLTEGPVFVNADAGEVEAHLRDRRTESFRTHTRHLHVVIDGANLMLEITGAPVRHFPMRRSCFEKLCMWHRFPADAVRRMDCDIVVNLFNGILGLIDREVNVRTENGDALTVTSLAYTELPDLTVLDQCRRQFGAISRVTRNDTLLNLSFDSRVEIQPVAGDVCGLGITVTNSETGFSSLRVSSSILRYICSNGAIVASHITGGAGMAHYGVTPEKMAGYLSLESVRAAGMFNDVKQWLARSVTRPVSNPLRVVSRLDALLGYGRGRRLMEPFTQRGVNRSQYDLFNMITHAAKDFEPRMRLRMEELAGTLLSEIPSAGGRQRL